MLLYFQLGVAVDAGDLEEAEKCIKKLTEEDEKVNEGGVNFYDPRVVGLDLLRVNVRKMATSFFKSQGRPE